MASERDNNMASERDDAVVHMRLDLRLDPSASQDEALLAAWAASACDVAAGAKQRLVVGHVCMDRCVSMLAPPPAACIPLPAHHTTAERGTDAPASAGEFDERLAEAASLLAMQSVGAAQAEAAAATAEAEDARRAAARAMEQVAHATREAQFAARDADQAKRDADQAKRDADQAKREAEHATRAAQQAKREAEYTSAAAERLLASFHTAEVQRLRDALTDAQQQAERLKGSNYVKGASGEAAVAAVFRRTFDDWAFSDTSSEGAQSDFRLESSRDGSVIAVEVKNKAVVTAGDVSKSVRDVRELLEKLGEGKLAGYAFVSLRTRNIPHKGSLAIECVHGVPVLWYGIDSSFSGGQLDDADAQDMARCAKLLADVGRSLRAPATDTASAASDKQVVAVMERLAQQLKHIDGTRRTLASLQDALSAARRHAATVAASLDASFRDLEAFLRAEGGAAGGADETTQQQQYACATCPRTFCKKAGLTLHAKRCPLNA
jgi:hypothetical protein